MIQARQDLEPRRLQAKDAKEKQLRERMKGKKQYPELVHHAER